MTDQLRAWVHDDFGLPLTYIEATGLGADQTAQLWRGTGVDGARYAVKLSGGGSSAGLALAAHLAGHGVTGIPAPVTTRDGRLWSNRDGRRLSVVPWVSDSGALRAGMGTGHWRSYGALLAQVHAIALPDTLAQLLPREDHTHDTIGSNVRDMQVRFDTTADAGDAVARAMAQEWRSHAAGLSNLLEQADALGRELRGEPVSTVVCHGDPHVGNVLIDPDDRVWLIDWDDAVIAPRERDLMFAIGGVLAFEPVTPEQEAAFFQGYGPVDLDQRRLAYYRCVRALDDVSQFAAQIVDTQRWPEDERAEALSFARGVLSSVGLVSLALASLRDLGRTGQAGLSDDEPATLAPGLVP